MMLGLHPLAEQDLAPRPARPVRPARPARLPCSTESVRKTACRRVLLPAFLLLAFLLLACSAGCRPATISSDTVSRQEIRDGSDRTVVAVVLQREHGVPWTKPQDVRFDEAFPDLTAGGPLVGLTNLMLANGGVISFPIQEGLDRARFRTMFTIAGGEPLTQGEVIGGDFYPPDFDYRPLDDATTPEEAEMQSNTRAIQTQALKSVALALFKYHETHGHFPPAVVYGEDGRPWHSWRVLILPYLGDAENKLYSQYDFTVPWDHARNLPMLDRIPTAFRCGPTSPELQQTTPIVVITGEQTAFPLRAANAKRDGETDGATQ